MNRTASLALLALVVATAGVAPVVAAQPSPHVAADAGSPQPASANGSEPTPAPGATLSGALSAHGEAIHGEVSVRAFSRAYDHAGSNQSKAHVVSAQAAHLDARLDALSARLNALRAAHENGSLSDGAYAVRAADTVARLRQTRRLANATVVAAADLPPSARATAGVDVTAIHGLSERAANLSDSPVATAGRSIAQRHTHDRGYGADAATQHRADAVVSQADAAVARAARTRRTTHSLSDAVLATVTDELAAANESLASAHTALDDGRPADAIAFAADAEAHAHAARLALTGHGTHSGTSATNTTGGVTTTPRHSTHALHNATTNTTHALHNATTNTTHALHNATNTSQTLLAGTSTVTAARP